MRAYLLANKKLYQKIENCMGVVHGVGDEEQAEAEQDDFHDDSDVPWWLLFNKPLTWTLEPQVTKSRIFPSQATTQRGWNIIFGSTVSAQGRICRLNLAEGAIKKRHTGSEYSTPHSWSFLALCSP
jgi:hypothetical protein